MEAAKASDQQGATRSADYTWRPPSPPHILIPAQRDEEVLCLPAYEDISGEDITNEELRIITQGSHVANAYNEWTYEMRRQAQQILPFLYLGPSSAARDMASLKKEGITMLLVIRNTAMAQARMLSGQNVADQLGIKAASVDVSGNQELIAAFPKAVKIINEHLISVYREKNGAQQVSMQDDGQQHTWGKVLVFCESGNERSPCVVAAYLMHMYHCGLVHAIQYVQSLRFCVAFDDSLKYLLQSYQQILEARRNVLNAQSEMSLQNKILPPANNLKGKRGRDSMDEDEDVDMAMDAERADDMSRFDGRTAFTPFK